MFKDMQKYGKLKSHFQNEPYQVVETKGSMIIAQRGNERKARNVQHAKKVLSDQEPLVEIGEEEDVEISTEYDTEQVPPSTGHVPRMVSPSRPSMITDHRSPRPQRERKLPGHFKNLVMAIPNKPVK